MAKKVDSNGFWEFGDTLLSREGVFPYLGKQIDQQGKFGLKPNQVYNVYRPRTEVCSEEFVKSLQNLPLVNDHTMIGEEFTPAEKKGVEGVMFNVHVDEQTKNTIRGSIKVFTERVKNLIKNMGKRELSLGYVCGYRRENGMYDGVPYDFVQYGLKANHVALVDNARMGSDCRVMDSAMCFDSLEITEMPDEEKKSCADALIEQLKSCSDEDLAKIKDFLSASKEEEPANDAEPPKKDEEKKEDKEEPPKDAEPPKDEEPAKDKADEEKKDKEKKDKEPAKDAEPPKSQSCDESIRKEVAAEYGRAVALAERCKSAGFTISMDGLFTEKDVAVKVCAMDGVKLDVPEDGAIAAIKGFLAGRGNREEKFVVTDSAPEKQKKSFDFLSAYKGE